VRDTVEEHVFALLYEKIRLFERVVGELDDILMKLQSPTFSNHLERMIAQSKSEGELKIKMQNFVEILANTEERTHAAR
jgi:Ca2+-binding EF-hand superfamily protein